jgi:hypothetical protein
VTVDLLVGVHRELVPIAGAEKLVITMSPMSGSADSLPMHASVAAAIAAKA